MPEIEETLFVNQILSEYLGHTVSYSWLPRRIYQWGGNQFDEGGIAHFRVNGKHLCGQKVDSRYIVKGEMDDKVKRQCKPCLQRANKFIDACQTLDSISGV